MIEAAKTSPHCVPLGPCSRAMAMGRVCFSGELMMVSAQANSSQVARKVKIVAVASAGRASGSARFQKRRQSPAPSICMAWSSSAGMASKKPRSRKVFSARLPAT